MKSFSIADMQPAALARIMGNDDNPTLAGIAYFYPAPMCGVYVQVEVFNLPDKDRINRSGFFGMHIHENGNCTKPFSMTGGHYNPDNNAHPDHAGDLPPLLSTSGYAWTIIYDGRVSISDIIDKSLVIHDDKDDFTSQPSGDSGTKIACGVIIRL